MRSGSLLLALLAAGCSTVPTQPGPLQGLRDALQACQEPQCAPRTNGELASCAQRLRAALRACNLQLDTLRERANEQGVP